MTYALVSRTLKAEAETSSQSGVREQHEHHIETLSQRADLSKEKESKTQNYSGA